MIKPCDCDTIRPCIIRTLLCIYQGGQCQCKMFMLQVSVFISLLQWLLSNLKKMFNKSRKIPGPTAIPVFGSSWLYSSFGPYSHDKYHESNFDKFEKYGPVVREEVLWNYPLIHLFEASDIDKVLRYKSDTPFR